MAYIITGATGHIGNNLVRKLISLNQEVKVLVRKIDRSIENLPIEYCVGNIFNEEFLNTHITSNDIVIHLAGIIDIKNKNKEQVYKINYEGANLIANICLNKKVKKYIFCSSVDALEMKKNEYIKEPEYIDIDKIEGNYGKSKALATTYLKIYFLGVISNSVYNFGAAILRAAGDTKSPLIFLTASGVLNVLLNSEKRLEGKIKRILSNSP